MTTKKDIYKRVAYSAVKYSKADNISKIHEERYTIVNYLNQALAHHKITVEEHYCLLGIVSILYVNATKRFK